MYIDKKALFSEQASVTGTAASAAVDLQPGYGGGDRPFIVVLASGFKGGGSVEIQLETSADESFASPRRAASFPIGAAALAAGGEVLCVSLPRNVERYVRLKYVLTAPVTALRINAVLALDV